MVYMTFFMVYMTMDKVISTLYYKDFPHKLKYWDYLPLLPYFSLITFIRSTYAEAIAPRRLLLHLLHTCVTSADPAQVAALAVGVLRGTSALRNTATLAPDYL